MFAEIDRGGRLFYDVQGRGEPLLLLRPLGGSSASWDRFATCLAETVQVISFDPRGVGRSSSAPWGWSTRQMAEDARQLLDVLRIPAAHVYGISLGGMVATWLSSDHPSRVKRLVLASTLPRGVDAQVPRDVWSFVRGVARPAADAEAALVTRILSPQFRAQQPDKVRRIQQLARAHPSGHKDMLTLALAALRHDARAQLQHIVAETLVLIGEYDPLLTVESQRTLLRALPRASYALVEAAGHDVSLEAPERTAAHVLNHILADG